LGVSSPKLVCIDIQPYGSTQAPERAARQGRSHLGERGWLDSGCSQSTHSQNETAHGGLNIGGFSDAVFNVVASYLGDDAGRFVAEVESIEL
jgi:60 kDa SS-A/Ro ribonucleoprotein